MSSSSAIRSCAPRLGARRVLALTLAAATVTGAAAACTHTSSGNARAVARTMLAQRGWSSQWGCLDALWSRESGWNVHASNRSSGAYGIPQALPGSKMASAGPNWMNDAATQIRWGLGYIGARYGSPCAAWSHSLATGWY